MHKNVGRENVIAQIDSEKLMLVWYLECVHWKKFHAKITPTIYVCLWKIGEQRYIDSVVIMNLSTSHMIVEEHESYCNTAVTYLQQTMKFVTF